MKWIRDIDLEVGEAVKDTVPFNNGCLGARDNKTGDLVSHPKLMVGLVL